MLDLEEADSLILERRCIENDDFGRFKTGTKNDEKQFCNVYNARLAKFNDCLVATAKLKWGQYPVLSKDLPSENDVAKTVIVIGTLYKHQEVEPSILKELSKELQTTYQPPRSNYSSNKDKLFLENDEMRVKLSGNHPDSSEIISGIVCALLGHETDEETFWVEDYCFPRCRSRISSVTPTENNGKLLLVSGFDFANSSNSLSLDLFREWICGQAGVPSAQKIEASIIQVLIAGDGIRSSVETYSRKEVEGMVLHPVPAVLDSIMATYHFDSYVSGIAENCQVILMPGQYDPTNHNLPQQALHPCILPKSSKYKTFRSVTNPWIGKIGNRIVSGSSGQSIDDIMRIVGLKKSMSIDWLEKTLTWCHFAPAASNTLPAYSYFNTDPFVMTECPDIYFAGNMNEYATRIYIGEEGQKVRLVCIPKFSKTATAVLVDLNTLDAWPISFGSS